MLPLTLIMHAAISYFFSKVVYAPINVNPVGGGGGGGGGRAGKGGGFDKF